MNTTWLSRRLGLDGNPLRGRIDKLAACMAALPMAVFLTGAPMLSVAATLSRPRAPGAKCLPPCCGACRCPPSAPVDLALRSRGQL